MSITDSKSPGSPPRPPAPLDQSPPTRSVTPVPYFARKGWLDRPIAAALLIPALPIIGLLVLAVRLTSRGPGIYRQPRVGKGGKRFTLYKIRTMRHDAEALTGPVWAPAGDSRTTPLGWLLRKFHLDELPQLFNVFKGEMSLVGPRPERPEFVQVLTGQIPNYGQRLAVLPGITGLAQLNLPPDTDLSSVRRKLALDLEYIEQANLLLDLRLLLGTAMRMFKLPAVRLLGLTRTVTLPVSAAPSANGSGDSHLSALTPDLIATQGASPAARVSYSDKGDGNGETRDGDGGKDGNGETTASNSDGKPHAAEQRDILNDPKPR